MLERIFLGLTALMYFAFGGWSLIDPVGMTTQLGTTIGGESGVFEMRGIYGGVSLGGALLCSLAAFSADFRRAGLAFIAAYMGGYVIGRSASFFAGDTAGFSNWAFAGFEAVMFVAALLLLMRPQK